MNEHRRFIQERFPSVRAETFEPLGDGWDCYTYEVDGEWIFQFPRLPGAEVSLRKQLAMLPELAQELAAHIPNPEHVSIDPPCMGYRKIEGAPVSSKDAIGDGFWPERLGRFLFDLHLVPPEFVGMRMIEPAAWRDRYGQLLEVFRARVGPLLTASERAASDAAFAAFLDDERTGRFAPGLIHHDLGPTHVLVSDSGDLAGIIDWGDAEVGDPAADFAWLLFGAPMAGERALAAYGGEPDAGFRDRARFYHRLGPWQEVLYGLETEQRRFVERGLAGVRERLATSFQPAGGARAPAVGSGGRAAERAPAPAAEPVGLAPAPEVAWASAARAVGATGSTRGPASGGLLRLADRRYPGTSKGKRSPGVRVRAGFEARVR